MRGRLYLFVIDGLGIGHMPYTKRCLAGLGCGLALLASSQARALHQAVPCGRARRGSWGNWAVAGAVAGVAGR